MKSPQSNIICEHFHKTVPLRHAFASALFAAWWLREAAGASEIIDNWARRALRMYCRPDIEARAVTYAYHIQLLLGHADLRVTFDRYIHLLDLAVANAVWMHERRNAAPHIKLTAAAYLAGIDIKQLRIQIPSNVRSNAEISLLRLEDIMHGRLSRLSETSKTTARESP